LAVQVGADGSEGLVQLGGLGVYQGDGEPFLSKNVCDTITHGTGADHGDILHMADFRRRG